MQLHESIGQMTIKSSGFDRKLAEIDNYQFLLKKVEFHLVQGNILPTLTPAIRKT